MVACFLRGELASERFGAELRERLEASGESERLLTHPDLADERANRTRLALLASTRGYGENRELFEHFPAGVRWVWLRLSPEELERVRYIQYSYWEEISGGSRFPADAAKRIKEGVTAFGVPNDRFLEAARDVACGGRFPPLILAGQRCDDLVCLEGHLRLTAHALAGFPTELECLVGIAEGLGRWTQ